MTHPRTTIRAAIVSLLVAASTAADSRVYNSRRQTLPAALLPALRVFTPSDDSEGWHDLNSSVARSLTAEIECVVADSNNDATAQAACDSLCREVEQAIFASKDISGTALISTIGDTVIVDNDDADPPVLVATVKFVIEYLDDFS